MAVLLLLLMGIALLVFSPRAKAAPPTAHGLVGRYYVSELPVNSPDEKQFYFTQIWINQGDFQLPEPLTDPAAVRADSQIAFGQGRGFKAGATTGHHASWAPEGYPNPPGFASTDHKPWDRFAAVIWRGFIHLPKAGTYYFATASDGASAVYLNQSRVALNGPGARYGHLLTSPDFSYDQNDVQDFIQNVRGTPFATRRQDAYAIPVTVDGARDLPIEVRYNGWDAGSIGIDLFWVTPDSPKNSSGKPIAKIVPPDAVYTEAPGPITQAVVRSANSTMSADLYCSGVKQPKPLTLTFRLADKSGHPVSGKRVYFTTLADEDFGFDEITQPDKPTDQNGITTAQLKSQPDARAHSSAIYATDITDLVDIGQVGHVRFPDVQAGFFISPCTAGFDPNLITVEPLPLMVGRPVTIKVKLENRLKGDVELNATFQATDWNIGANTWQDIGHVDNIPLKPGETKEVSMSWTPTAEQTHQCFKVRLSGKPARASRGAPGNLLAAALPALALFQEDQQQLSDELRRIMNNEPMYSAQRNLGNVAPCDPRLMALYTLSGHGVMKACFHPPNAGQMSAGRLPNMSPLGSSPTAGKGSSSSANPPQAGAASTGGTNPPAPGQVGSSSGSEPNAAASAKTAATNLAREVAYRYRVLCDRKAAHLLVTPPQPPSSPGHWLIAYRECENERIAWENLSQDPPAQHYRGLAVAQSDTAAGYLAAAESSMERYRTAQANGDMDWAARQLKAMQMYLQRAAAAERHAADEEQKQSDQPVSADDKDLSTVQAAVNDWTGRVKHGGLQAADVAKLQAQGFSAEEAKSFGADLGSYDQPLEVEDAHKALLDSAALRRSIADQADQIAALSPEQGMAGESFVQTYRVFNPHDQEETVDLFVRPLSMPASWKVYVANVLEGGAADASDASLRTQAKYPVAEVQGGNHYSVTLPAKTGVQLASVLVPAGEVGANTTARWAVEGQIRGEVIGAMVHEMNVPYAVAELTLPAVGSKEQMEEGATPAAAGKTRMPVAIIVAVGLAAFFLLFLVFWRRRRQDGTAPT